MQISDNSEVIFHYALLDDKGKVVDTSREGEPASCVIGRKQIVPGLEAGMMGHSAGDKFQLKVKAEQGYGAWDEDNVYDIDAAAFGDVAELELGTMCQVTNAQGDEALVTVVEINEETVSVDANHPYAGVDLKFSIEILEVRKPSA
ncbi:MAG: FKBP-type peptidyl-prolyl cis-trans isomerase [Pseudomonadales bacterium]